MSTQLSLLTSTSFAEDSPARTSRPQELARGLLAAARACGVSSLASYPPSCRVGSPSKTPGVRLAAGWTPWLTSYSSSAMKSFRSQSRRGAAALPTSGTASSCLPTLTVTAYGSSNNGCPGDGRDEYATKGKPSLQSMVRQLHNRQVGPTLLRTDADRGSWANNGNRQGGPRMTELFRGALSPTWCEQYMGFPIGWTELEPSATPSSRTARKSPGTSSGSSKAGEP